MSPSRSARSTRAAFIAAFTATLGASEACGQGDPAPTAVAVTPTVDTQPQASAAPVSERCPPGATRDCTLRYADDRGQEHCLPATQFCTTDGERWLPCGERPSDDAGTAGD